MDASDSIPDDKFNRLLNKALNNIYKKRGGVGEIDPTLFELNNRPLQNAIDRTFSAMGVEFGKRNEDFINQFKYNTSVFAAFKSHKEADELIKLTIDEKGDLRSFHEFEKLAKPIVGDYNRRWLKTEHEMTVRSARMAANWKKFEERKHIFPNLEFMKSRAKNKRETHLEWVGTILPMDHPWWDTHTPPIDWGCECWIRQTREAVTTAPEGNDNDIPETFRNNPGKTAEPIAIDKHPYVTGANISKHQVEDWLSKNLTENIGYTRQDGIGKDNGYLDIHALADRTITNRTIGELLANTGHKVRLLPDIPANQSELRKLFIPDGVKPNKNPDAMIGGRIFEFKTLEKNTYNAVSKELKYAGDQADFVLINIKGSMDDQIINRAIRGRIKLKKNIQEVWVVKDGYVRKYDRNYILGDQFGRKSKTLR
ncbi:hypothetical protein D0T56_12460 [Dysgonomonas sp. 520]|nr:hypothetical protein [Dysgonomonas sp. 520]